MKIIFASLLAFVSGNASAASFIKVECSTKVAGKSESMKIKLNLDGSMVFWSKKKVVDAAANSYFSSLANLDDFGLEGTAVVRDTNGYQGLRVINTAESIEIAVHQSLKKAYFFYRDDGSGNGSKRLNLSCKRIN